jgi:phosphoglycolate phosphatase
MSNAKATVSLVVFDLDGTLVNAYPAIARSFNFTMRSLGYPQKSLGFIRRSVGWGDKQLIRPFVSKKDFPKAIRIYREVHRKDLPRYSRLMPGAKALLRRLKRPGVKLAIASNRPTKFARLLLVHLRIAEYFDYVRCADTLARGKPHPRILQVIMQKLECACAETVFVGDMAIDAETARNAGVRCIMVTTGSSTKRELSAQRPWRVVPGLGQITRAGLLA